MPTTLFITGSAVRVVPDAVHIEQLCCSAGAGNIQEISQLIAKRPDLTDGTNENGMTALMVAAYKNKKDPVKELAKVADVDAVGGPRKQTALHRAAIGAGPDVITILVASGANINACDSDGSGALHHSAYWGNVENIRALIELGAKIDAVDHKNYTPLHGAAKKNQNDAVDVLLGLGAECCLGIRTSDGDTPDDLAKDSGHNDMAIKLRQRQDMPHIDNSGSNNLHRIVMATDINVPYLMSAMQKYTQLVLERNDHGLLPLHVCICNKRLYNTPTFGQVSVFPILVLQT